MFEYFLVASSIISVLFTLYFWRLMRRTESNIGPFLNLLGDIGEDPEGASGWIDELAGSFFKHFKMSVLGERSGDTRKRAAIGDLMRQSLTDRVLPALAEANGINPVIAKVAMGVLQDSPIGDYLDEHPEDLPDVIGVASQLIGELTKNRGFVGGMSNTAQTQILPAGEGPNWG